METTSSLRILVFSHISLKHKTKTLHEHYYHTMKHIPFLTKYGESLWFTLVCAIIQQCDRLRSQPHKHNHIVIELQILNKSRYPYHGLHRTKGDCIALQLALPDSSGGRRDLLLTLDIQEELNDSLCPVAAIRQQT